MALPTSSTPVAKSLHTLTVLQQVTRLHQAASGWTLDVPSALLGAMDTLGLAGRPDPYGLHDRALALMTPKDAK
jgi:hypothetical protein